jgi:hypothetical protein
MTFVQQKLLHGLMQQRSTFCGLNREIWAGNVANEKRITSQNGNNAVAASLVLNSK